LGNILARVRAGVWERPEPPTTLLATEVEDGAPLYEEYADWWLQAKIDGVIGEKPISRNTESKDRWRLRYSQSFFAGVPVDEIDRHLCLDFKAHLLAKARKQREALEAGADLRERDGRRVVPLSLASIKMILDAFASVLDEAIEDEHREGNPARSKRMRVKVPKPKRTFLEMDELAAVLDAAREQDVGLPDLTTLDVAAGSSPEKVARLAAAGKRPKQIAVELSLSASTVTYHLRRLKIDLGRSYVGRRVVCELLGRGGLRASELCDLKIGRVRLHDPEGARLRIEDSKTEAGVRIVEMTPALAEVLVEHIDRLRRAGMPTGPDDYLVPNACGGRISRQRIRKIVAGAAKLASERLVAKGLPPLPQTTPHTLRRTYISIALLANEFDLKFVMAQVGHADSSMTTDVYAQLQQRVERHHGANFDRLVRKAHKNLDGALTAA
jgi:integrase